MEYRTNKLAFAAFLTAGKHLSLLRIEKCGPTTAVLVFSDPNNNGPDLEASFLSGEGMVSAAAYHSQFRLLRRKIESAVATQVVKR